VRLRAPDDLLRAPSASPVAEGPQIELVIARRTLRFSALTALASGARCFVGRLGQQPVLLRQGAKTIAQGELILWRAALGVRLTET
jgi:flagellar motor switch/type III secretory pathway protein FliN